MSAGFYRPIIRFHGNQKKISVTYDGTTRWHWNVCCSQCCVADYRPKKKILYLKSQSNSHYSVQLS